MPLFEYRCTRCNEVVELFSGRPKRDVWCTSCGGGVGGRSMARMERVPSAAALKFEGGGWAKDGYSSPARKKK